MIYSKHFIVAVMLWALCAERVSSSVLDLEIGKYRSDSGSYSFRFLYHSENDRPEFIQGWEFAEGGAFSVQTNVCLRAKFKDAELVDDGKGTLNAGACNWEFVGCKGSSQKAITAQIACFEIAKLFSALGAKTNGKDEVAIRLLIQVYGYDSQQSRFTKIRVVESDPMWFVMDSDVNFRVSAIMFAEEKTYIRTDAQAFGAGAFVLSIPWILGPSQN